MKLRATLAINVVLKKIICQIDEFTKMILD